jgi:tetratricopeptide (TPR) repeat protein
MCLGCLQFRRYSLLFVLVSALVSPTLGRSQDPASEKLMEKGTAALRRGDFAGAAETFSRVTIIAPQFAGGFFDLGLVRVQQGKWEESIAALQKCVQLDSKFRGAHLFLGIAEYRRNRYAEAKSDLKRELELAPKNADAWMWLGIVQLVDGDTEGAVGTLDRAAALSPDNVDILYHRGRAHMLLSQKSYEHMYEVDPKSWRIHQVLAQSFVEQERYEEAARECKLAIQDHPEEPGLHEQLGDIYWKQNQLEPAESAFAQEVAIDPQSISVLYKLGAVSLERSKPQVAEEIMRRVLQASPGSIEAHYQLGRAQAQLAQYEGAIESFSFVTANNSRADKDILRQSYYQLSQLYRRSQKLDESKKALQVFLSMKQDVDSREDKKLQDKLKRAAKETVEND